jgi:hypothetical protein
MRSTLASLSLLAVLLVPGAAHGADLPLEVNGVQARQASGGGIKIVFGREAAGLYRRIAGRSVRVDCRTVPPTTGPALDRDYDSESLANVLDAPERRRVLELGGDRSEPRYDTCRVVGQRKRKRRGNTEARTVLDIFVPLTQRGAVYLDERTKSIVLVTLLTAVESRTRDGRYPSSAEAIEASGFTNAVPLDDPAATPPAGKIGLYTDAAQRAVAVAVTKSGRRVFLDVNGESLSTNLTSVLFDE